MPVAGSKPPTHLRGRLPHPRRARVVPLPWPVDGRRGPPPAHGPGGSGQVAVQHATAVAPCRPARTRRVPAADVDGAPTELVLVVVDPDPGRAAVGGTEQPDDALTVRPSFSAVATRMTRRPWPPASPGRRPRCTRWHLGPRQIRGRPTLTHTDSGTFGAIQHAGVAALNDATGCPERLRATYREGMTVLCDGLERAAWKGRPGSPAPPGHLLLPRPQPPSLAGNAFASRLLTEAGVLSIPATGFGPGGQGYTKRYAVSPPSPGSRRRQEATGRLVLAGQDDTARWLVRRS